MYPHPEARVPRRIRVLIVDDNPETVQNVQKLLRFEPAIHVVGTAASGQEAIAKAIQLRPGTVLMDINLRDMDGLKAAEEILRAVNTNVVMMSVQGDREYFQRAFRIGARGFLVKPFTSDELIESILRLPVIVGPEQDATNQSPLMRRVITVYSPKGGVGRSVIAANLAIMLRQQLNARVLLVDANLASGDAHVILNLTGSSSIDDLCEAALIDEDLLEGTILRHEQSGISLLRAPLTLESALSYDADVMKAIVLEVRERFDYVVIDADSTYSETTRATLEMAKIILTLTTLEVTTINCVGQFLEIADNLGFARTRMVLACNRVADHYGIKAGQVEARMRSRFISQIPEDIKLMVASVNHGLPYVPSQKNAPVTKATFVLAQRIHELASRPDDDGGNERHAWGLF